MLEIQQEVKEKLAKQKKQMEKLKAELDQAAKKK